MEYNSLSEHLRNKHNIKYYKINYTIVFNFVINFVYFSFCRYEIIQFKSTFKLNNNLANNKRIIIKIILV